ncbi:hypothetical protein BD626DRAFT_523537 [Schizophyllum amplum]|uniref:Uncharacterized protein n=1 Tax=Schizophyllum amplum TaxID=97359 RepID=A0A550BT03_9AGAR|nr:hypothetical protein BD626DRAFT_523537 [Auriculariopsis ampla]
MRTPSSSPHSETPLSAHVKPSPSAYIEPPSISNLYPLQAAATRAPPASIVIILRPHPPRALPSTIPLYLHLHPRRCLPAPSTRQSTPAICPATHLPPPPFIHLPQAPGPPQGIRPPRDNPRRRRARDHRYRSRTRGIRICTGGIDCDMPRDIYDDVPRGH